VTRWPWMLFAVGAAIVAVLGVCSVFAPLIHPSAFLPGGLIAVAYGVWRSRSACPSLPDSAKSSAALRMLATGALIVALALGAAAISRGFDDNPQGQWDAWSIWNLRAKLLASPEPARAWSPLLTNTHPEYPLLVSGAEAVTGSAPAVAILFFASLIAMVTGGIAIARGPLAGLIAGLTLASTGALLHEVPSQYADVPVAAYLAGALVFILIDRPIWAGVFASLAAWTKDEGALFCVALLVLLAIFRRKDLLRAVIGMLPGALFYLGFKTFLAPHVTAQFGPGTLSRLADFSRWSIVLKGVATQILSLGAGWFHPIFIIAALAIGVRFRKDSRRDAYFATALAATILLGYCATMVAASADAVWQTNTAAGRLVVQWWPLAVIAMITWMRPAEDFATVPSAVRVKKRK
jgi:hypothetical protein